MKRLSLVMLVVLGVVGLVLTAEAGKQKQLPVFDEKGDLVPPSRATAVGTQPVEDILNANIKIAATVPQSLKVSLSSTKIDWTIKDDGTYQTRAIDIVALTNGSGPITMTVSGAENLKNETAQWDTYYAVKIFHCPFHWPIEIPRHPLDDIHYDIHWDLLLEKPPFEYIPAKAFNGTYDLTDPVFGRRKVVASIWNKIVVPSDTTAGVYSDEFTVTFSQAL